MNNEKKIIDAINVLINEIDVDEDSRISIISEENDIWPDTDDFHFMWDLKDRLYAAREFYNQFINK